MTRSIESVLADIKRGLTKKLWKEFTGRKLIGEQEVKLKKVLTNFLKQWHRLKVHKALNLCSVQKTSSQVRR